MCNFSGRDTYDLKRHVTIVHERKKSFQCHTCSEAFFTNSHLKSHVAGAHEGKKPHKCEFCDATFPWKSTLLWHMKKHH